MSQIYTYVAALVLLLHPFNPAPIPEQKPNTPPVVELIEPLKTKKFKKKQYKDTVEETPAPETQFVEGDWVSSCHKWAAQVGVSLDSSAIRLIEKESRCNPNAQNPSSTAYGIGQFLNSTWAGVGCVKTSNPPEQIRCMYKYVVARYKTWGGALAHSNTYGWY